MSAASDLPEGPADDDWLIVPNWDRFQHYKTPRTETRRPAWIKVYTDLLRDPDYLGLSLASKGLLHNIWLAYATCGERLTVIRLRSLCHDRFGYPQLISLNRAGFLDWVSSNALAQEVEEEEETPLSPYTDRTLNVGLLVEATDLAADWQGGTTEQLNDALDELERKYQDTLLTSSRQRLHDLALARNPTDPDTIAEALHRFTSKRT